MLGLLLVIAIVTVIIVVVVRLANKPSGSQANTQMQHQNHAQPLTGPGDTAENRQALAILNERYARGEIEDDEFQKRKKNLTSS